MFHRNKSLNNMLLTTITGGCGCRGERSHMSPEVKKNRLVCIGSHSLPHLLRVKGPVGKFSHYVALNLSLPVPETPKQKTKNPRNPSQPYKPYEYE